MHPSWKHYFCPAFLLAITAFSGAFGDDHVLIERVRSGMGMRYPARTTEVWLSETGVYIKTGRMITIARYDLQKRWTLSPEKKRFVEESLAPLIKQEKTKENVAIQRMGWDYEPVNDWTVNEVQREEVIGDQRCKLIVADGDADYSSESIEFWVTDKVPIDLARFNERVTATMSNFDWQDILKTYSPLKKFFIVKSVDKTNSPIAPEITIESTVTKLEVASPPPKIYEIPDGFQKVNSIEELTN